MLRAPFTPWSPADSPSPDLPPFWAESLRFGPPTLGMPATAPVPAPALSPMPLRISGWARAALPEPVARIDVVPPAEIIRVLLPPGAAAVGAIVIALARTARTADDVKIRCLNKLPPPRVQWPPSPSR